MSGPNISPSFPQEYSMKMILMTMAAVSALGLAAPTAAAGPSGERTAGWQGGNEAERQARWGGSSGDRAGSGDQGGDRPLARWEDRSAKPTDRDDIEYYSRWDDRSDVDDSFDKDGSARDDRFDRDNRGDRFAGDVRVGQVASTRMSALPELYRAEFRDDDRVYYRYDDRRIYQLDRRNGLILGLLDLPSKPVSNQTGS
jgi:hypothetical protein